MVRVAGSFFAVGAGDGAVEAFGRGESGGGAGRALLTAVTVAEKGVRVRASSAAARARCSALVAAIASGLSASV